ncbi:ZIP family metal transporter [Fluviispira sanaruensis]|uniref:ZIP family metal transporter n=1 Tax=Fluviispira sanaruensis TaxID=2493639 RepID=A0A4P2VJ84_FLUSA|nr:ZIP family metal transporter [Fluviispira sanaruensis]BBH52731.1 ZIP family metal transporter [Fluviispira sanaruensis]
MILFSNSFFDIIAIGVFVTFFASCIGALPIFFTKNISIKVRDILIGISAGVMLGAVCFSLLNPAIAIAETKFHSKLYSAGYVSLFVILGSLGLSFFNKIIPHEHFLKGREGMESKSLKRIWLFILAITIHNFPEGLAVGVGLGSGEVNIALPIIIGIALQDIPEGLVVALSLKAYGFSNRYAINATLIAGFAESIGALLGCLATSFSHSLLPGGLALAGGAMLYVICGEMIPELHRSGNEAKATAGFIFGFVLMMFLDVGLS